MRRSLCIPLLLLALLACGGGSNGDGGYTIDNDTTEGVITIYGSATVAGVTYDTDAAEVERNGQPASTGEFSVGERVIIEGPRSGSSGTAERIVYSDDVEGPVDAVDVIDLYPDGSTRAVELTILGQTVEVARGITELDGGVVPDFTIDDLVPGNLVEVSGLWKDPLTIVATRLTLLAQTAPPMPDVELKGEVTNLVPPVSGSTNGSFEIGGVLVDYDEATTVLAGFPGADPMLAEGDVVAVGGVLAAADTIDATNGRIDLEAPGFTGDLAQLLVEGYVSDFDAANGTFRLGGQLVNASGRFVDFEPSTVVIGDGVRAQVDGQLVGGVLVADRVSFREPEVLIAAPIADGAIDTATNTITMLETIPVDVVPGTTRFEGVADLDELAMIVAPFVTIRGVRLGGRVSATWIAYDMAGGDVELEGRIDGAFSSSTRFFTLVGVRIDVDAGTGFFGFPTNTEPDFFQYLSVNPSPRLDVALPGATSPFTALGVTLAGD